MARFGRTARFAAAAHFDRARAGSRAAPLHRYPALDSNASGPGADRMGRQLRDEDLLSGGVDLYPHRPRHVVRAAARSQRFDPVPDAWAPYDERLGYVAVPQFVSALS